MDQELLITPCPECRAELSEIVSQTRRGVNLIELVCQCLACEHVWGFETFDEG